MLRVEISTHFFHVAADASSWRIPRLLFEGSTLDFMELRVINVRAKNVFDCG
jgi:hypothetical protein